MSVTDTQVDTGWFEVEDWPAPRGGPGRVAQPNPYEGDVLRSYETGEKLSKLVDASEAKGLAHKVRQAAQRQDLGVSVQVKDNGDGSAQVTFLGKVKRGTKSE